MTLPATIVHLLEELRDGLDGALALVSGRRMAEVDRITTPVRLSVAGVHGAEWRDASGETHRASLDPTLLDEGRRALGAFAASHPGVWLEDKGPALALHYRANPAAEAEALTAATRVAEEIGPPVAVLPGKMIVELRHHDATKAAAVTRYLEEAPFAGRVPAYLGDDVTDEDAFDAVNARDGVSVRVGGATTTAARYELPSVNAVHAWLEALRHHL